MKLLPFILLFSLLGCGHRELASERATRQIQQWVPAGTPIAAARQIMEHHRFTCLVTSYTNKQGMVQGTVEDADAHYWDTHLWVGGTAVAVTNITTWISRKPIAGA
jgi:hypothetical protein